MANPKRRHSQTRGRKRRTHQKLAKPALSTCSHCGAKAKPHRICLNCGYYNGKPVIVKKVKKAKKEEQAA